MSCFIVDDCQVNQIVSFAHAWKIPVTHNGENFDCSSPDACQVLATALRAENVLSFLYRYEGRHQDAIPQEPIVWEYDESAMPTLDDLVSLLGSYDYNACEHPEYPQSLAKAVIETVKAAVAVLLPGHQAMSKAREHAARDAERARLLHEYAHLEQPGKYTGVVLAARNIRTELKRAFPGIKFSVKGSSYSMGNSIYVRWEDGPTTAAVDAIVGKYRHGDFDGMTDSYDFSNRQFPDLFGGTYYMHTSRDYGPESIHMALAETDKAFGLPEGADYAAFKAGKLYGVQALRINGGGYRDDVQSLVNQWLSHYDATTGAVDLEAAGGFWSCYAHRAEDDPSPVAESAEPTPVAELPKESEEAGAANDAAYDWSALDGMTVQEVPAIEIETLTGARVLVSVADLVAAARVAQLGGM